jgi:methylenetetrahydrofolate reductase (NADPH)
MTIAAVECPKHMTFGPCGGVDAGGGCELGDRPCPFVPIPLPTWPGTAPARAAPASATLRKGFVLADLPHVPLDALSISRSAAALAGRVDAVLFGDTGWCRVQLPPSYRAMLVAAEGRRPWAGLNCRDRNRVALEAEVAALAHIGASVHCITGDHTDLGNRPDAQPVFDFDSTRLASLASSYGVTVSVGENPAAPPLDRRGARLAEKVRAGAQVCIVNFAGSPERVSDFIAQARAAGVGEEVSFLVCVPLVVSENGLAMLRTYTGLALPDGYIETIESAPDPMHAAIDAAARYANDVLALDGVTGVDLSSAVPLGEEDDALAAILAVCEQLQGSPS